MESGRALWRLICVKLKGGGAVPGSGRRDFFNQGQRIGMGAAAAPIRWGRRRCGGVTSVAAKSLPLNVVSRSVSTANTGWPRSLRLPAATLGARVGGSNVIEDQLSLLRLANDKAYLAIPAAVDNIGNAVDAPIGDEPRILEDRLVERHIGVARL